MYTDTSDDVPVAYGQVLNLGVVGPTRLLMGECASMVQDVGVLMCCGGLPEYILPYMSMDVSIKKKKWESNEKAQLGMPQTSPAHEHS